MKWANTAAAWTRTAPATAASSILNLMTVDYNKEESDEETTDGLWHKPACGIGNGNT